MSLLAPTGLTVSGIIQEPSDFVYTRAVPGLFPWLWGGTIPGGTIPLATSIFPTVLRYLAKASWTDPNPSNAEKHWTAVTVNGVTVANVPIGAQTFSDIELTNWAATSNDTTRAIVVGVKFVSATGSTSETTTTVTVNLVKSGDLTGSFVLDGSGGLKLPLLSGTASQIRATDIRSDSLLAPWANIVYTPIKLLGTPDIQTSTPGGSSGFAGLQAPPITFSPTATFPIGTTLLTREQLQKPGLTQEEALASIDWNYVTVTGGQIPDVPPRPTLGLINGGTYKATLSVAIAKTPTKVKKHGHKNYSVDAGTFDCWSDIYRIATIETTFEYYYDGTTAPKFRIIRFNSFSGTGSEYFAEGGYAPDQEVEEAANFKIGFDTLPKATSWAVAFGTANAYGQFASASFGTNVSLNFGTATGEVFGVITRPVGWTGSYDQWGLEVLAKLTATNSPAGYESKSSELLFKIKALPEFRFLGVSGLTSTGFNGIPSKTASTSVDYSLSLELRASKAADFKFTNNASEVDGFRIAKRGTGWDAKYFLEGSSSTAGLKQFPITANWKTFPAAEATCAAG